MASGPPQSRNMRGPAVSLVVFLLGCTFSAAVYAQSSGGNAGTVRGTVLDPSGAAIMGAAVEIQNPVSHYNKTTKTDNQGNFEFFNVPLQQLPRGRDCFRISARRPGRGRALVVAARHENTADDRQPLRRPWK